MVRACASTANFKLVKSVGGPSPERGLIIFAAGPLMGMDVLDGWTMRTYESMSIDGTEIDQ
jgi:hypothetical protein